MAQAKRIRLKYTAASLINARYEMGKEPSSYHDMEDRYFVENNEPHAMVFCVFDGHDGPNAVNFVSKKLKHIFRSKSWRTIISVLTVERNDTIVRALREFFMTVDKEYFDVRRDHIKERQRLQRILGDMKSFEAFQLYPDEVKRLQFLDEEIRGGSTAAMAAMCGNVLYVSNVGDSRVLLYSKDGSCLQLTCDHNTDNKQELQRLSGLGLDAEKLKKNHRVGTHENTRSFGDYNLKEGFLDVDSLKVAKGPVGTAEPHVTSKEYNPTWKYIVLMTDGIYKSLESIHGDYKDVHRILLDHIEEAEDKECVNLAEDVVRNISILHHRMYLDKISSHNPEIRKSGASCVKKDDMTLIVIKIIPLD